MSLNLIPTEMWLLRESIFFKVILCEVHGVYRKPEGNTGLPTHGGGHGEGAMGCRQG